MILMMPGRAGDRQQAREWDVMMRMRCGGRQNKTSALEGVEKVFYGCGVKYLSFGGRSI